MKVFIIAGEESGDIHASNMVRELKKFTDISLYGTGGKRLKELGQEQYFSSEQMTIIGLDGIIKNIPLILNMFKIL
jgi:lipid-A-disaccharide synthase